MIYFFIDFNLTPISKLINNNKKDFFIKIRLDINDITLLF